MSAPCAAKPSVTALSLWQAFDLEGFEESDWRQDKLSDAFAMEDFEWFRAQVDEEHLELPTVVSVDRPGAVGDGDTVAKRQP